MSKAIACGISLGFRTRHIQRATSTREQHLWQHLIAQHSAVTLNAVYS